MPSACSASVGIPFVESAKSPGMTESPLRRSCRRTFRPKNKQGQRSGAPRPATRGSRVALAPRLQTGVVDEAFWSLSRSNLMPRSQRGLSASSDCSTICNRLATRGRSAPAVRKPRTRGQCGQDSPRRRPRHVEGQGRVHKSIPTSRTR